MPPSNNQSPSSSAPNNQITPGITASDRSYLIQQATNDFVRTVSEVQNIYFGHMKELSQSGAMGAYGMQAMQNMSGVGQSAALGQGIVGGAALAATAFGSPIAGAAVAGIGTIGINYWVGQQQVINTQLAQQGQGQMLAGQIASMSGGNPMAVYNNFMGGLDPTRYGVGVERLAAFDAFNQGGIPSGMGHFNSLLASTMSPMNPEGNLQAVMRMGAAERTLAGLSINSLGMSPAEYTRNLYTVHPAYRESEADFGNRILPTLSNKQLDAVVGKAALLDPQWHRGSGDWGADADAVRGGYRGEALFKALEQSGYRRNERASSKTINADAMRLNILLGGEAAAEAYRNLLGSDPDADSKLRSVMGGDYRSMRFAEQSVAQSDLLSGELFQQGNMGGALGARGSIAGGLKTQLDILRGEAYHPNGAVKSPEAALRYRQLSAALTSTQAGTADMAMSGASVGIASMSGQANVAFGMGSFGNTGAIGEGLSLTLGANSAEIERVSGRLNSGNLNPEQRAGLEERLYAAITRNIEAFDRATSSVMQMGQVASQTGTAQAMGGFQRGVLGGASGREFGALAGKVSGAIGNQLSVLDNQIAQRTQQVLLMGGDPAMDARLNTMKQQHESFETQSFQLDRQAAIAPLAVGTRREMARTDFNIDILQTMPGAVGAIRKEMQAGIGNTQRAYSEMEANRADRMKSGKWMEVDQERFEQQAFDIKRKEAGYRSSLMEGFESRLTSTVINAPGNIDFVSPEMSYRVAVGAGLKGARFGSNKDNQHESMREAFSLGSVAGNTSTNEGFYVTAMTGARHGEQPGGGGHSLAGMTLRVVLEDMGEDGRTRFRNGTAHFTQTGNTVESSAAGLAENSRRTTSKY